MKRLARDELVNGIEGNERFPDDESGTRGVDPSPTRTTGQLRIVTRFDHHVARAVILRESIDDDGPCGHVHTDCESFGRKHDLDESERKTTLNDLLEDRHHSRVMSRNSPLEEISELRIAERCKIVVGKRFDGAVSNLRDPISLVLGRQRHSRLINLERRIFTTPPAEDEVDRRQTVMFVKEPNNFGSSWRAKPSRRTPALMTRSGPRELPLLSLESRELCIRASVFIHRELPYGALGAIMHQDLGIQRNRSMVGKCNVGWASNDGQPSCDLVGVPHSRRQANQYDLWR